MLLRLGRHVANRAGISHIHFERQRAPAVFSGLRGRPLRALQVEIGRGNVASVFGEGNGNTFAEAASGSRDERYFSGEVEQS